MRRSIILMLVLMCSSLAYAQPYNDDEFALARHVTNEAGLPDPRRPTIDGALIGDIAIRNARSRGLSVAEYIRTVHYRHTREDRRNNRWILGLDTECTRPPQWRPEDGQWEGPDAWSGCSRWTARLDEARSVLRGTSGLVCGAQPRVWGGPYVDRKNLLEKLVTGRFRVVAGPPIAAWLVLDPTTQDVLEELNEPIGSRRASEQCHINGLTRSKNVFLMRVR